MGRIRRNSDDFVQILTKFNHDLLTESMEQILEIEQRRQAVGELLTQL